ncbi:MAG TPA: hypothetical protein VLD65_01870 [Anaerolineales bacterium]|nr:hypothetical protein [Anaerolineales bacterium]
MDKKSETLLRRLLKNWANRHCPPENARARLLWEAAQTTRNKIDLNIPLLRPQGRSITPSYSSDWTQTLFTWINENSFQYGLRARLI